MIHALRRITWATGAFLTLLIAGRSETAASRAGGGESFSRGSPASTPAPVSSPSRSDRSKSSEDDAPYREWTFDEFLFSKPFWTIIALGLIFPGAALGSRMRASRAEKTRGRMRHEQEERLRLLMQLAATGQWEGQPPDLVEAARFCAAFLRTQAAWSAGDLAPVRAFASDALLERFTLQLHDLTLRGLANHVNGLEIKGFDRCQRQDLRGYQTVTYQITATAVDEVVDVAKGKSTRSDTDSFVEYWTFVRRLDGKVPTKCGLIEGACPNCAAPLAMSQHALCAHCGIAVRSGAHDWVLCEITQNGETWQTRLDAPGVEALVARDPDFSPHLLEDRASLIFWRIVAAVRAATPAPCAKVATAAVVSSGFVASLWPDDGGMTDIAVGGVALLEIVDGAGGVDVAFIHIAWSGRVGGAPLPFDHILVLTRSRGVASRAASERGCGHCANCGVPLDLSPSTACPHCAAALNDGAFDWVLADLAFRETAKVAALRERWSAGDEARRGA